jgi:glycine betaine/proline transport system permease protein
MNIPEFLTVFPKMGKADYLAFKKTIDGAFREFSRSYGDSIESFFDPVLFFLVNLEKLLQNTPWPIVIIVFLLFIYYGSRNIYLTIGSLFAFLLISKLFLLGFNFKFLFFFILFLFSDVRFET